MSHFVLLPGLICDQAVWQSQCEMLSQQGHDVHVLDYGELDSLVKMAELTLQKAPDKFILIGHSMGGRIAMEVVRQSPQRIVALGLMDTGYKPLPSGKSGQQEIDGRLHLVNLAKTEGMRIMGERWMQGMVLPQHLKNQQLRNDILDMIARKTVEQFENQQNALIHRPDATGLLTSITCPSCFICGDQDLWSPFKQHVEMSRLVKDSVVHSIQSSGHMSTMEQPEQVNKVLQNWYQKVIRLD